MKQKHNFLFGIVILAVFLILINQIIWLKNMYYSYQQEMFYGLNDCLDKAIHMELANRLNEMKSPMIFKFGPIDSLYRGKNEIVKRKIQSEDTTMIVEVNKNDPNVEYQIIQFFYKDYRPIDVEKVKILFESALKNRNYEFRETYIDYYDLNSKKVISKSKSENTHSFSTITTDTVVLDIMKSIGVKAYVDSSPRALLKKMFYQIIFSVILIIFASFCLIFLLKIILRQQKYEKMRQDFVNTMVHEFKRPISNASTMIELVPYYIEKNNKKKANEYLKGSLLEFKKLIAYTDRIQRISNNESDHIILEKSSVRISILLDKLKTLHSENNYKVVIIETEIETPRENLDVDVLHFSNVMDNLIENAIKYSGKEVHIKINVREISGILEISVKDDGIGISDKNKKLIFEKFYRVDDKSTIHSSGFGLGLTYVKAIIEAHGGNIRVFDSEIRGSNFVIHLPI